MSVSSFFNSAKTKYELVNLGGSTSIPASADATLQVTPIIKSTGDLPITIDVPAGIYNLQMFGQLDTTDNPDVQMGTFSFKMVDMNDPANAGQITTAIFTSSSHSIKCISDGSAWVLNHFQRVELPEKMDGSKYKLTMIVATVYNTLAFSVSNGPAASSAMGISAKPYFYLSPTF